MSVACELFQSGEVGETRACDNGLSTFMSVRPRLFGIAYRMLGSAAEAEDILQDLWVRWQTTNRDRVINPTAFLVTATRRLALNLRQSARVRRETDADPRLPEPADTSADPAVRAEQHEAVTLAIQLLLEKLSSTERAAYVLREAFNYPYRTIANVLRIEEANARQLVVRARDRVSSARCEPVCATEHRSLLEAFIAATKTGDLTTLEKLFAFRGRFEVHQRPPAALSHTANQIGL